MARAIELSGTTMASNANTLVVAGGAAFSRTDVASVAAATGNSADTLNPTTGGGRMSVNLTALTGTTPAIAFALFDSADNSSFAAVPGVTIAALNAVGTAVVSVGDGVIIRRYVAIATTVTGTTPSATFTAVVEKDIAARITTTDHNAKIFGREER